MDIFDSLFEHLGQQEWAMSSSVWPIPSVQALFEEAQQLYQEGLVTTAHIGQGQQQQEHTSIRKTYLHWFDPHHLSATQAWLYQQMESIRCRLNEAFFLSLHDFECHYAVYPPGAFYRRHLDQFRNNQQRKISFILYLNADWQPENGGMLRMYLPTESFVDIPPQMGTFVMFRSPSLEHEVLPTHRTRYAVVGWMRTKDPNILA